MNSDFKAALDRVQSDYAFYIQCQSDPGQALTGYSLSPQERAMFSDPGRLAASLKRASGVKITISGTHDWVNRAVAPEEKAVAEDLIAREVESVKRADSDEERSASTLRLIRLLG